MLIHEPILAIHRELSRNEKIIDILGEEHVKELITVKPTLNATELNEKNNAQHFVTLSIYQISEYDKHSDWILKVGIAMNSSSNTINNFKTLSELQAEVIREITREEISFGFAEQVELTELEETYFDDKQTLWGYTHFFVVSNVRFKTSLDT